MQPLFTLSSRPRATHAGQHKNADVRYVAATVLAIACALMFLSGCAAAPMTFQEKLAAQAEAAHRGDVWDSKSVLAADLVVNFGGNRVLEGRMMTDTAVGKTRFELKDGTVYVFDGTTGWVAPADKASPRARFHMLTWPYFLAAPFKLDDPGTHLASVTAEELPSAQHPAHTGRLTFGDGVGDAPDDWYIVCLDPMTGRLASLAYIVTYGKSAEEANKDPHAVTYETFVDVDGVILSSDWKFWNWSPEQGIHGDPIGDVSVRNFQFVEVTPELFAKPAGAAEAKAPGQ